MDVLALSRMLGHSFAKITSDIYADLSDTDHDAVAEALHSRYSATECGQDAGMCLNWPEKPNKK